MHLFPSVHLCTGCICGCITFQSLQTPTHQTDKHNCPGQTSQLMVFLLVFTVALQWLCLECRVLTALQASWLCHSSVTLQCTVTTNSPQCNFTLGPLPDAPMHCRVTATQRKNLKYSAWHRSGQCDNLCRSPATTMWR